jgi:hypothetical protein
MTYPAYNLDRVADATDAHHGPTTCSTCGCRLQRAADGSDTWFHFAPMAGRDARGCRISCSDAAHDAQGHARAA